MSMSYLVHYSMSFHYFEQDPSHLTLDSFIYLLFYSNVQSEAEGKPTKRVKSP